MPFIPNLTAGLSDRFCFMVPPFRPFTPLRYSWQMQTSNIFCFNSTCYFKILARRSYYPPLHRPRPTPLSDQYCFLAFLRPHESASFFFVIHLYRKTCAHPCRVVSRTANNVLHGIVKQYYSVWTATHDALIQEHPAVHLQGFNCP